MNPEVLSTSNYDMFMVSEFNRSVKENSKKFKKLVDSMRKYGWLDGCPMSCVKNGKGFKILIGHHRFRAAQILGIPVKYVLEKMPVSIPEIENVGPGSWKSADYLVGYRREGLRPYQVVHEYMERTGIGLKNAASMFGGETAGSHNHDEKFRTGKFAIKDFDHPALVGELVLFLKKMGIAWASTDKMVMALSKVVRVEEFSPQRFKKKAKTHPYLLQKQKDSRSYVAMIEDVYNRQAAKNKCLPISFLVEQKMAERNAIKNTL